MAVWGPLDIEVSQEAAISQQAIKSFITTLQPGSSRKQRFSPSIDQSVYFRFICSSVVKITKGIQGNITYSELFLKNKRQNSPPLNLITK